jgi:hypothetical protein
MNPEILEGEECSSVAPLAQSSEIDTQVSTAKRYPRSIKVFRSECLDLVTLTEEVAQDCIYALPRAGKTIEGPSARFAEIIATSWGNCRSGSKVLGEDGDFIVAQGMFYDLEKNTAIQYEVKRRIVDKNGKKFKPDMIGVTANAACSIAHRNAVLKGIPKALWNDMYKAARQTVMGDAKTLSNRRSDAIVYLQKFGATPEMICKKLEVSGVEDIGLEELLILKGLATAIKDGETTVEMAFSSGVEDKKGGAKDLEERMKANKSESSKKKTTATKEETAVPPQDPEAKVPKKKAEELLMDVSKNGTNVAKMLETLGIDGENDIRNKDLPRITEYCNDGL